MRQIDVKMVRKARQNKQEIGRNTTRSQKINHQQNFSSMPLIMSRTKVRRLIVVKVH